MPLLLKPIMQNIVLIAEGEDILSRDILLKNTHVLYVANCVTLEVNLKCVGLAILSRPREKIILCGLVKYSLMAMVIRYELMKMAKGFMFTEKLLKNN